MKTRSMTLRRHLLLLALAAASFGCASTAGGAAVAGDTETTDPAEARLEGDPGAEGPLSAGFLVVDGVYNTELMAPYDVFEHSRHHSERGGIRVFTVSPDGGEITTAEGLRLQPDYSFDNAPAIDILVVPSAEGSRDENRADRALIDWVRTTGEQARFAVSFCWGAFVLAEAGLLDGHASTTFPADYARFANDFPELDVRFNVSFVHDRGRLTSQGGARSYDAAMYLVDRLLGEDAAAGVGRGLLITWPPPPGQRPAYVSLP